jgi:hypothetical protein
MDLSTPIARQTMRKAIIMNFMPKRKRRKNPNRGMTISADNLKTAVEAIQGWEKLA